MPMMTESFFTIVAAAVSFVTVVLAGKPTIAWLAGLKMRQAINTDAPKRHMAKQGTPTMGGILFLFGVAASLAALWVGHSVLVLWNWYAPPQGRELYPLEAVCAVFVAHLGLGFLDDYLKATRGKSLGLKARQKLAGQLVIAICFTLYLYFTSIPGMTTAVTVWRELTFDISPYIYYPMVVIVMIGMSNFTNLTDGLDGLAGGLSILALIGLAVSVTPGYSILSVFAWILAAAVAGFLVFNVNPAKVFMGDTGSLALGSTFAAIAILEKQELPLFLFGLVFVIEGISVVLQVISFKTTGRRIFKMAPLHHHFELIGWTERQVVIRFWMAGALALLAGLFAAQELSPWKWR
jgi:phospho-N-acetylmuramoyl-pentapeptide-transferase